MTARAKCSRFLNVWALVAAFVAMALLGGCASLKERPKPKAPEERASIFGQGGLRFKDGKVILGTPSLRRADIEVNLWLWRAALEMGDKFGVSEADPWGGTVVTKWQDVKHAPEQRVRFQAFILGSELVSKNLVVHLFVERRSALYKETEHGAERWSRFPVSVAAQKQLKRALLTRAWELRSKFQRQH